MKANSPIILAIVPARDLGLLITGKWASSVRRSQGRCMWFCKDVTRYSPGNDVTRGQSPSVSLSL